MREFKAVTESFTASAGSTSSFSIISSLEV
jgi:hypothetical protein